MRIFFIYLAIILSVNSEGQDIPLDKFTIDTIHLKDFKAEKIVAYKYHTVTFYVDYDDCRKVFSDVADRYNSDRDPDPKSDREKRRRVLNSTLKFLVSQAKKSDTVYLSQAIFDPYDLAPLQNFLPDQIEKGNCVIKDERNNIHLIIIRQKGSWQRGPLSGWGGRRYFIPGQEKYFISGTDWIS